MNRKISFLLLFTAMLCVTVVNARNKNRASRQVEVGEVVSAFPVGFDIKSHNGYQYVAYYDSDHNMVVARRKKDSNGWQKTILPSKVGWDSHNSVTFDFDQQGYIHLAGNMHGVPLIYFRSAAPESIDQFDAINRMTGSDESRVTYPVFMKSAKGDLIFHYRSGSSGNGYEVYNIYDSQTKTWSRMLDQPLIDGRGERNAYMQGPLPGKDGYYHLIWVWRDSPDCSTNHTLSYARSKDMLNWESVHGEKIALPITIDHTQFVVDGTPSGGGLFNPGIKLGFDSEGRPVIGYHKYDSQGNNQLYAARFENQKWNISQLTNWDYCWAFRGGGSMKTELSIYPPRVIDDKSMGLEYDHIKYGKGEVVFDMATLQPKSVKGVTPLYPLEYDVVCSQFPGMIVNTLFDGEYLMRWETLPANRDRKPQGELPPPSKLVIYKLKKVQNNFRS